MKVVVVGLGYVGLSNAVLLAQHNEVIGVDISQERVDALNARKSPIIDAELSEYLTEKDLNLSASNDLKASLTGADYVIVSTPTNYDETTNLTTITLQETLSQAPAIGSYIYQYLGGYGFYQHEFGRDKIFYQFRGQSLQIRLINKLS